MASIDHQFRTTIQIEESWILDVVIAFDEENEALRYIEDEFILPHLEVGGNLEHYFEPVCSVFC